MGNSFENLFSDIATIIRTKDGTSALIYPNDFATRINALNIGLNSVLNITANDYSSSTYKSDCYITCTTSEGYTETISGTFSSSGNVSFNLKYIGTYIFHYTCLDGSIEYSHTKNISNIQNGETYDEEVEYQTVDPTKSTLTEEEFIYICQKELQSQMTIGAIITLANTYQTQWEVIGKNHDGTSNTVDIMSHTNINSIAFGSSSTYYSSALQTFCSITIPNAFTNATTKSLIKTMSVKSKATTISGEKGKALSCTEIGYSDSSYTEGASYGLSNYMWRSGVNSTIWTRTPGGLSRMVYYVNSGSVGQTSCSNSYGVLPVLRF